jgi:hypothetical protein
VRYTQGVEGSKGRMGRHVSRLGSCRHISSVPKWSYQCKDPFLEAPIAGLDVRSVCVNRFSRDNLIRSTGKDRQLHPNVVQSWHCRASVPSVT